MFRIILFVVCFSLVSPGFAEVKNLLSELSDVKIELSEFVSLYSQAKYKKITELEDDIISQIEGSEKSEKAKYYNFLGYCFQQTDNPDKSEKYYSKSIEESQSIDSYLFNSYYNLGISQLKLDKIRDAEDTYKKFSKMDSDHPLYIIGYSNLLRKNEKFDEAEKFVLEKYSSNPNLDDSDKALILDQLGGIYKELRLENKARSFHLESFYVLSFSEMEGLEEQLIFNLKNIGDLYFSIKEYDAAYRVYESALSKASEVEIIKDVDQLFRLREQHLITEIFLGNFLQGIFKLSALIGEESDFYGDYHENIASLYLIESDLYLKIDNEEEALSALSKAENILNLYSFETEALLKIYTRKAQFFSNDNKPTESLEYLNKGLDLLLEKYKNPAIQGEIEYKIADQLIKLKELDMAMEHLESAKKIISIELGDHHPSYYLVQIEKADIFFSKSDTLNAIEFYKNGLKGMLECYYECSPAFSEQQKIIYLEEIKPAFYKLLNILSDKNEEASNLINDVFSLHISMDNLLFERDFDYYIDLWSSTTDDKISQSLIRWLDNLDRLKNYYLNPYPFKESQLKTINEIKNQINEDEGLMSKRSVAFREARKYELKTWNAVSENLEKNQIAIDVTRLPNYLIEKDQLDYKDPHYAFFIIKPGARSEVHFNTHAIDIETKYLSYMRNTFEHSIPDYYSYETYWLPIEEYTNGAEIVYFSAEGAYCLFNLNALQNPEDSSFVLDKVDIRYVNSTWDVSNFNPGKRGPSPYVYLLGEPNYDLDRKEIAVSNPDEVKIQYDPASTEFQKDEISENVNWNEFQFEKRGKRDELLKTDSLYKASKIDAKMFSGGEVNEETIQSLDDVRSMHFTASAYFLENKYSDGTHNSGFIEHPLNRSGLVLSGAFDYLSKEETFDYASNEDGLLTGIEISRLNLENSQLIFLSATNGNLGIIKNWESVKIMQQAFEKADAKSIIMTLWNMNPDKEVEMTAYFYENLLSDQTVHDAFRGAQMKMREKYQHPSFWGSLVYIGE